MMTMRNTINEFFYSSTAATTGEFIVSPLSSAVANNYRTVRITDLKASCGATARTITVLGRGSESKPVSLDLAADSVVNLSWNIPWRFVVVSSTGTATGVVASASGAGVKYAVSGYFD